MNADCHVAIVGSGPVGALLGNLLGRRGISVRIIEKQPKPYDLPRAIHFDGEAMRVFQAAGLAEQVLPSTRIGQGMLFKDADDKTLIDWSREQTIGPMGWHESYRVHQPALEDALLEGLNRFENVTLTRGATVETVTQGEETVELDLNDGTSVTSRYVVGCDGATSHLRDALGIAVEDLGYEERWLVVDLLLKNPRNDLGNYTIQFCEEDNPATYARGLGDRRRWEFRLKPDHPSVIPEAFVWDRLARWIGPEDADLERSAVYTFRSCVAKCWKIGRCFLAGDAAHQMPPFMGQGMCAGIRDVANLAWKLDCVLKGANTSLLETYHSEREPNVRQFIDLTMRLGKLINQTAVGNAPRGAMKSIWPSLGEGFGARDGVGGELAPQIRLPDGQLADDHTQQGFYILAKAPMEAQIPVVVGQWEKLDEFDFPAALIRPDGYAAMGIRSAEDAVAKLRSLAVGDGKCQAGTKRWSGPSGSSQSG